MRKVILILCCILLVACQEKNGKNKPEASDNPSQKENLVLKEWKYLANEGDGNDDGYYRLSHNDGETHLLYTDYSTGQEIYLCNKPECQHKDESCTSYLPFGDISEMFVYKDHLYFIESAGAVKEEKQY